MYLSVSRDDISTTINIGLLFTNKIGEEEWINTNRNMIGYYSLPGRPISLKLMGYRCV